MADSEPSKMNAEESRSRPFLDLLPERWRLGPDVWARAYRMVGVPLDVLRKPVAVDLRQHLVVFFWGGMPRMSLEVEFEPRHDGEIQINVKGQDGSYPSAPTALVMTPINGEWNSETINRCQNAIQQTAGLLSTHSMSLVAVPLEDYVIRLPEGRIEPTAVKVASGTWLRHAAITATLVEAFEDIGRVLEAHPERSRLGLALRWMDDAMRTEGVDAVVKAWVALETLAMPNTTNIRPINESLARIYGLTVDEARDCFLTGRLAGLRSDIVHNGDVEPVDDRVVGYLHALFKDLLFAELGSPPTSLAQACLDDAEAKLREHIIERTTRPQPEGR